MKSWSPTLDFIFESKSIIDLVEGFNNLFDPTRNGFTHGIVFDIPTETREIWTDSPSYMISTTSSLYAKIKATNENK